MNLPAAAARPAAPPAAAPAAAPAEPGDDLLGQLLGGKVKPAAAARSAAGRARQRQPRASTPSCAASWRSRRGAGTGQPGGLRGRRQRRAGRPAARGAARTGICRRLNRPGAVCTFWSAGWNWTTSLQVHLLDAPRADLVADIVAAGGRIENTGLCEAALHRWCAPATGERCAALIALARIWRLRRRHRPAGRIGHAGSAHGRALSWPVALGPGRDPSGCRSWQALRRSEVAPWVALVAPRLLLRLPYGKGYEATERLAFEELPAFRPAGQAGFVWGMWCLGGGLVAGPGLCSGRLARGRGPGA
jgi:type VI secretion system protein ImpC